MTKIVGIRVQDINRQIWYNWDRGAWDANGPPQVLNNGLIYVAVYFENQSNNQIAVNLKLRNDTTNTYLTSKTEVLAAGGGGLGIEWTGLLQGTTSYVGVATVGNEPVDIAYIPVTMFTDDVPPPPPPAPLPIEYDDPEPEPSVIGPCICRMAKMPASGQVWIRKNVRAFMPKIAIKAYYGFSKAFFEILQ